jgi:PAS domain S-box-containing protein
MAGVYKEKPLSLIKALRYSAMILIPLFLLFLGFFLWSWSLRKQVARRTAELAAVSERQQAILAAVPDIVMEVNAGKIYTWANPAGFDFFGEDVIGRKADEYFVGEQDTYDAVKQLFNGDENVIYVESWQRRKDGGKRLLAWWCRVLKDNKGRVTGGLSTARDITEQRQVEEASALNYSLLRIAVETAQFGGWSVDLSNNTCTWSEKVADIHDMPRGYSPPLLDGINFYAPECRDKITQVFTDCAEKGINYDEEMEIITRKGRRVWVRTTGEAVRNEKGEITKVQGSFQDITAKKRAEQEHEKLQARLIQAQKMESVGRLAGAWRTISTTC